MTAADRPTVTPRVGDPITTGGELGALPGVRVIVDPDDETGDAPVVLCRASDGPWAALTTGLLIGKGWWTSTEIASAAKSVRVVYIPGEQSRPSVTDNARAEAERRYPSDVADRGLTYPTGAVREHSQAAFVAGAEWAAGRAETTTVCVHCGQFIDPEGFAEDGSSNCAASQEGPADDLGNVPHEPAETTTATVEDMATRLAAAEAELDRLCDGGRFIMSIPAREGYDSDLLIQAALTDLRGLLALLKGGTDA